VSIPASDANIFIRGTCKAQVHPYLMDQVSMLPQGALAVATTILGE
jgi:hypothetical protein